MLNLVTRTKIMMHLFRPWVLQGALDHQVHHQDHSQDHQDHRQDHDDHHDVHLFRERVLRGALNPAGAHCFITGGADPLYGLCLCHRQHHHQHHHHHHHHHQHHGHQRDGSHGDGVDDEKVSVSVIGCPLSFLHPHNYEF